MYNNYKTTTQGSQCSTTEVLQELQDFAHHPFDRGKQENDEKRLMRLHKFIEQLDKPQMQQLKRETITATTPKDS